MPTPSPGIIIAASVLVAAGVAIYNDPQVQEWLELSRRKIVVAWSSLGDDLNPRNSQHRPPQEPSPAEKRHAVDQARKKRDSLLANEKSREMFTRQRDNPTGRTFDDFLPGGNHDASGDGERSPPAAPVSPSSWKENEMGTGSVKLGTTTALSAEEARNIIRRDGYPFIRPRSRTARSASPAIDTTTATQRQEAAPNPAFDDEDDLACLTPTSSGTAVSVDSPCHSTTSLLRSATISPDNLAQAPPLDASFHSFSTNSSLPSDAHPAQLQQAAFSPPQAVTRDGDTESVISDADLMSDAGPTSLTPDDVGSGRSSPYSWTEVGSEVSDDGDYGGHS